MLLAVSYLHFLWKAIARRTVYTSHAIVATTLFACPCSVTDTVSQHTRVALGTVVHLEGMSWDVEVIVDTEPLDRYCGGRSVSYRRGSAD